MASRATSTDCNNTTHQSSLVALLSSVATRSNQKEESPFSFEETLFTVVPDDIFEAHPDRRSDTHFSHFGETTTESEWLYAIIDDALDIVNSDEDDFSLQTRNTTLRQ